MPGKNIGNLLLLVLTFCIACMWAFPIYWAIVTSMKPEQEVVSKTTFIPDVFNFSAYYYALFETKLSTWYLNSIVTSITVTVVVIVISVMCAYALSQIVFPGRKLLYGIILASFMVPSQALVISQFVLMHKLNLINTWGGIILPQLIVPVVVIVYKQFFDSVPKELREAAKLDGCGEFQILFKLYLPLNWGITTALAIITYIMAWNAFLWPFLVTNSDEMMTITVGITQTRDAFGVKYARDMAVAILAAMPVAVAYLLFQKRVTQALMLSSGIKG
ncbi:MULTISPECIES: carbohydrate ABC transporter permease [unclassified Rhizobium]|uniref:carbohydrate ABC transporter permease n=1 Tax=unclassified Rhizobium TaxID=2613769 RepID=UPI00160EBCA6|nr:MULTISPECIES: carbohydrate ABC transporter permease [unclassified Rhizobium]MBB3319074.1 multiple sugar transport system permease protein [Rhizobium sp. BK181]MBB3544160.1 multiple sugar transport system permease protein [Rhizobium sp. BK399]MCS3743649.1 multiple sugar transport system permease protein [Rhizobium sp. BK661]MCS4094725.1 multiple sugar transport system permease protein [Rhizobium sp. BK176]